MDKFLSGSGRRCSPPDADRHPGLIDRAIQQRESVAAFPAQQTLAAAGGWAGASRSKGAPSALF